MKYFIAFASQQGEIIFQYGLKKDTELMNEFYNECKTDNLACEVIESECDNPDSEIAYNAIMGIIL